MKRSVSLGLALALVAGLAFFNDSYQSSTAAPSLCGDVNGDGKINLQDVILELRMAVGLVMPTAAQLQAGDVAPLGKPDGRITITDVSLLLKVAVGLVPQRQLVCAMPTPTVSFSKDVQPIFDNGTCTNLACHGTSFTKPAAHPMMLVAGQSYAAIVNVPAEEQPNMKIIDPGHPENSYLLAKIKGTQVQVGGMPSIVEQTNDRMPQLCDPTIPDPMDGGCLPDAQIATIQAWIQEGAPNN